ncbi:outer dense fiber protein 2-like isoform X2 [Cimex lectularius]|uniref:Uncharacterized protein n=2 Tax=Cimex lectularius TaxID=79782 RepID=A0A8I6R7K9_CIMLE|nr:outer dense fiber protein 2-like isoform X2 [Cimex lectularius]
MEEEASREQQRDGYGCEEIERELVRCLSGDARAVARVCTDIVSWTGPVHQDAWENPNKNVNLINYLEQSSEASLQYIPALEQTLDILHLYLRLIVSYFNQMPMVMEAFRASDLAIASKRVTLPALVWMLWSRARFVNDELYRGTATIQPTNIPAKDSKTCQTDIKSLTACENCTLAQDAITRLVELMEKICTNLHIKGSQILEVRKSMTNDLFYITQWCAVSKWCDALLNDIDLLGNLSWQSSYQSKKAHSRIKQIKQETTDYEDRLKALEEEKNKLRTDIDKAYESKANYIKKVSELTLKMKGKNSQIDALEKKCAELESMMQSLKKELIDCKQSSIKEKERFIDVNNEVKIKIEEIEKMKAVLDEQTTAQTSKSFELQNKIDSQEGIINSLQQKIEALHMELDNSAKREETYKLEILKEQNHGAVIWRNYETLKDAIRKQEDLINEKEQNEEALLRTIELLKTQIACGPRSEIELTGDPIMDMENQKKENEETIKRLSEHNIQIEKTLHKLYSISTPELC